MELLVPHQTASKRFVLGFVWTGLIMLLMATLLAALPQRVRAEQNKSGELLYGLLGYLEWQPDYTFAPVDDVTMQKKLAQLITHNRLDALDKVAYIRERFTHTLAWEAIPTSRQFDTSAARDTYDLQTFSSEGHQLTVQNFWLTNANTRLEYQMVVVFPNS